MRELTSFDHFALSKEVESTTPTYFQKLSLIPGGYKLKLRSGDLLILLPDKYFFTEHTIEALSPDNLSLKVRKELRGRKLTSMYTLNLDRVVVMDFEGKKLVLELFRRGNILLLDEEDRIITLLREESWRHRELKPGVVYVPPPAPLISGGEILTDSFIARDLVRSGIPKPYAYEIIYRLGVDEKEKTVDVGKEKILEEVRELLDELSRPRGYVCGGEPYPIELSYLECESRYPTFSKALDSFLEVLHVGIKEGGSKKRSKLEYMQEALKELDAQIQTLEKLIEEVYMHWSELEEMLSKKEFRSVGRLKFKGVKGKEAHFEFTLEG